MVQDSNSKGISGHTKVTLPHEEAAKAPFPPGCKVLCFDENGFRVGIVSDVLVFISLHEGASYGTYYEVEIKGANEQAGKTSVFSAADLRLTPDSPVSISPEYFGSFFQNNEGDGNIEGIVLGSFEIPPTMCSNWSEDKEGNNPRGKFFYSVRVRFPGMDEAVEAHGVPPEHVIVLPDSVDHNRSLLTSNASIMIGGGSYDDFEGGGHVDHHHEKRTRTPRMKPRRVTPEDMHSHRAESFDQESVRDGYYHEDYADESLNDPYGNKGEESLRDPYNNKGEESLGDPYEKKHSLPPPQSIRNIISNTESHFYDTGSESEYDRHSTTQKKQAKSNRSLSRGRSNKQSRGASSRSVSRTRSYVRSHPPIRTRPNKIPSHDQNSLNGDYNEFKDNNTSRKYSRRNVVKNNDQISVDSTDDEDTRNEIDYTESVNDVESENSDSYVDQDSRHGNMAEEEYDSITFHENDDYEIEERREINHYARKKDQTSARQKDEVIDDESTFSKDFNSVTRSATPAPSDENRPESTNKRSGTPARRKAFGKTWSPSNQSIRVDNTEASEKPKVGKLHGGARGSTPVRIRATTPLPSRVNTPSTPQFVSKLPDTIPKEGCYLIFDSNSGGRFIVQFSRSVIQDAIGFWAPGPGKKLQGFKFKQNQGKSDLMKGIAGKDYKKKYFSGWCQYVKAAKSFNGYFVKYSKKDHIEVDLYVFFHDTCEIEQVQDAKLIDVSQIAAVACVAKGNSTFDGVKTAEFGTFLGKGAAAGASLALL